MAGKDSRAYKTLNELRISVLNNKGLRRILITLLRSPRLQAERILKAAHIEKDRIPFQGSNPILPERVRKNEEEFNG